MGIVAHGTGDEVWDWLFEPNSPDLDEYYLPEELAPFQDGGGQELVMDLVAIGVHHRPGGAPPALPSVSDLLAAFEASGRRASPPSSSPSASSTSTSSTPPSRAGPGTTSPACSARCRG